MKKKSPLYNDDEIDLIALFKIIWKGKIKILLITIISFLIGFGYSTQIPINYVSSLPIKKSHNSEYNKFVSLANSIKSNRGYQINQTNQLNEEILNRFIGELKDYEEFLFILKNNIKVRENFENLPIEDQEKKLFSYANLLNIIEPKINEIGINNIHLKLNFTWKDPDEAKDILRDTLNLTLNNLEKSIYEELEQSLKLKKEVTFNKDRERINYLQEQSSIARELNIKDNEMFKSGPYYVRGYQAIDKEIDLIKNRDYKNFKFFEQEINSFKKEKIQWINYNIYLIETKSLKNTTPILIKSVLLGFILSILYVFFSNIFKSHTVVRKN
jgi:LPS O-antigen subunit length determinant protein (WzzB/FepE family)